MKQILAQFFQFILKNSALLVALSIGMVAKIAIDSRARKLTKRDIFIKIILSSFVGYSVGRYLQDHNMASKVVWVVPLATLTGESLILWIMVNFNKILSYFAKMWTGMKDEDFKDKNDKKENTK